MASSSSCGNWRVYSYSTTGGAFTFVDTTTPVLAGTIAVDVDGDGYQDLAYVSGGVKVQRNLQGTGFAAATVIYSPAVGETFNPLYSAAGSSTRRMDFNGDGCTDVVVEDATSGYLMVSYGACDGQAYTSFSTTASLGLLAASYPKGLAVDWDGDRRDDLLLYSSSAASWGYRRSTGSGFAAWTTLSVPTISVAGDFNGDGLPDLGTLSAGVSVRLHAGVAGDLATSFTDGFGVNFSPTYAPMSYTTAYTKGTGAVYPEVDYSGTMWLVTSYSASDGVGGNYSVSATYNSARFNMQGRGFEGFAWTQSRDSRSNYYAKTQFNQLFPLTGMVKEQTVYQANGTTVVSDVLNTVTSYALDSTAGNQRWFPYVSQSVTSGYEVNGALNGVLVSQQTRTISYLNGSSVFDVYGNPWTITTSTVDKDTTSPWYTNTFTDVVHITPHEDASAVPTGWCVGLADQVSDQRTQPGGASLTHTVGYAVSTDGTCRLQSQTVEPGSTVDKVVTAYGYTDGCNNVNSITVTGQTASGAAMTPRPTTIGYGTRCLKPESITNALGQSSQIGYRYDLGLQTSVTDPNGLTASTTYNDLGQVQTQSRPDGTQSTVALTACSGSSCLSDPLLKYLVQRSEQDATSGHTTFWYTQQYFDALGRLKYDRPLQSNGAQSQVAVGYDSRGRQVTRTNPAGNGFSAYVTTTAFDDLNRPTSASRPISATNPALESTTFTYQGRTRTVRDPRLYTTTKQFDVLGELMRVTDPDGVSKTNYAYNPFGALTSITDPANSVTTRTYDGLGYLLTGTADPDRGTWTYQFDSLGELINLRDAKTVSPAWTQVLSYDALGRLTQRVEAEGTTTWTWGTVAANHEIGQLVQISGLGDTETNTFDSVGRAVTHSMVWGGTSYAINYAYNSLGKLDTLTYPSVPGQANRFQVKYGYVNGYTSVVQNYTGNVAGTTFWQLTSGGVNIDPWGHVVDETLGTTTPVRIQSAFDAVTSWIGTRQVGTGGSANNLQSLAYQWDVSGNLAQRQDLKQSITEAFTNDNLNRLQSSTLNSVTNLSVAIDPTGNITSRTECVGGPPCTSTAYPYTYDTTHKHAVASVGSVGYSYDANGNMATRNGSSISWATYNLPTLINGSGVSASFSYGPDRQRKQQVSTYTADGTVGTETTVYVGGIFEVETTPGQTHYKHFVSVPGGTRIIYDLQSVSGAQTTYVTADHLGSGNLLINASGSVLINESYSAYGYRRTSNWSTSMPAGSADYSTIASTTRRGYSDAFHEMLDDVGLIHMNGRVYDPMAARFISPDPATGFTHHTQSWNPYSYVWNSPLRYVDPSGRNIDIVVDVKPVDGPPTSGAVIGTGGTGAASGGGSGDNGGGGAGNGASAPAGQLDDVVASASRPGNTQSANVTLTVLNLVDIGMDASVGDSLDELVVQAAGASHGRGGGAVDSLAQSGNPVKRFLCAESPDGNLKTALDTIGTAGSAADLTKPIVAIGATAAGVARSGYPQATAFLGGQLSTGLAVLGRAGGVAALGGVALDALNGDAQSFAFDLADYAVYTFLADVGAAGAVETLGTSVGVAGFAATNYYIQGGSKGIVQSALCH